MSGIEERYRFLKALGDRGIDPDTLAWAKELLNPGRLTIEAQADLLAPLIAERLRANSVDYFPQLPHIIMNASLLASKIKEQTHAVRGGVDVFRSINADAVEAALRPLAEIEGAAAKLTDSLEQSSRLLLGEDLDEATKGEAATWLTTSTDDSSPKTT